jgi:hypothetical protein
MSTTRTTSGHASSTRDAVTSGTTAFAGIMLATLSGFGILQGIAAILSDDVYVQGINYTYELDVTTWGWVHLLLGVLGLATGIGLVVGQSWALVVGLVIAMLSALANFTFIPYYPFWALAIIAFDAFVIWALCQELSRSRGL